MQRRQLLTAALLAAVALAVPRQASAEALDDMMKAKVIKIAVPQDFAPFGSAGLDLKPVGYDIDMANLIGKELGVAVELVPVNSANRIPYLQTKKVDLVISSLGKNPEREKVIDFSNAYAPFFQGVFGRRTPRSTSRKTWPARRSAPRAAPSRSRRSPSWPRRPPPSSATRTTTPPSPRSSRARSTSSPRATS